MGLPLKAFKHQVVKHADAFLFCAIICASLVILGQLWAFEEKWHWLSLNIETPLTSGKVRQVFWKLSGVAKRIQVQEMKEDDELHKLEDTEGERLQKAALCLGEKLADPERAQLSRTEAACVENALLRDSAASQSDHKSEAGVVNQTLEAALRAQIRNCQKESIEMKGLRKELRKKSMEVEELRKELHKAGEKLRRSISFLEMKDLKEQGMSSSDRTWFMSSLRREQPDNGDPEAFYFPSETSKGRLLCVQGRSTSDGTKNSYGFAWKPYLPPNSTLLPGVTLVADNYWDYLNPWHSMSALVSFVAWQTENRCVLPDRLVLYHWGELVPKMGQWITKVLEASLGVHLEPDPLQYEAETVCFEQAVVHRRGVGGMSQEKLQGLFETVRCKVRKFCKVKEGVVDGQQIAEGEMVVNVTLLLRSGARAFKNESGVAAAIEKACRNATGCMFKVAHIANLSFCEQVEAMSRTDILITAHGAQLTNIMFMSKGSSVMEMYPKGWLEYAGIGQFIYKWLTDWTGLRHEGTWRDPDGEDCPYPASEELKCFLLFKDNQVGHNDTHLSAWTSDVLQRRLSSSRSRKRRRRRDGQELDAAAVRSGTQCACQHIQLS